MSSYFDVDRVGVNHAKASLVEVNRLIQTPQFRGLLREGYRFGFQQRITPSEFGIRRKRRSIWFFLAKDALKEISDLGQVMSFGSVVQKFENWRESCREKYIHLSKGEKHLFIKSFSRFDLDYRYALKKKLKMLDFMLWDLKIELTIDPKRFFRLYDEFLFINKAWNKLHSWLHKKFGEFEHLKVLEITKAGRPHLHVLISGIKWVDQRELSDIWASYGCGEIVYIKRIWGRDSLKMGAYVLKYVNKTLKNEDKVYSALLFASNRRLFSLSRGCQNMLNGGFQKEKQGFSYEGTVLKSDLVGYCDERGLEMGYYLLIDVEREDYYEFPTVFNVELRGGGFDYG